MLSRWELEPGETLEQCLKRELKEELSIDVNDGRFLACGTFQEGQTTTLEMFFICHPISDRLELNEDHITADSFYRAEDLLRKGVYPHELSGDMPVLLNTQLPSGKYFGGFA